MNNEERYKTGNKVAQITIVVNVFLSFIKLLAGILGRSTAMVADGIHSLSDVLSSFAVIIGLKMAKKPADYDHPYGHEKMEPIMTKILAIILFGTTLIIAYEGISKILSGDYDVPEKLVIYGAILSIAIKEWMYRYTAKAGKKIESSALIADAWHHRSDAFSSICTLIGVIGARMGLPILDPIASIIICIFIGKVAFDIYMEAVNQLVDHSADEETIHSIEDKIMSIEGVIKVDELKTRVHANKLYVDVDICVNKNLSVKEGHNIAEKVHLTIEESIRKVKHCMVHVNPNE